MLFTSCRRSFTALARSSSAGPATNLKGLTRAGLIGLVEFGVMCGSKLPAGKSYQGVP